MTPESFGERVRFYRILLAWDQKDLAERIHKSVPTISRIESGKASVTLRDIAIIAQALSVPMEHLLVAQTSLPMVPVEVVLHAVRDAQGFLGQVGATLQTLEMLGTISL